MTVYKFTTKTKQEVAMPIYVILYCNNKMVGAAGPVHG